jgi:FkbM family methyltransferase
MLQLFRILRFISRHPLASKRPLRAIWNFARWQIESRARSEVEFKWIGGAKLIARRGMTGASGNIYCGLHEFSDMGFLLHLLRPDDLFVDVGANIGSYTVLASAVCGARTVAVEPDPDTAKSLRKNVVVNGIDGQVRIVEAALGEGQGAALFTTGQDTTNHVVAVATAATREVEVRSLDDVLQCDRPVLIKMDVEGYETHVIRGAGKTLRSSLLLAVLIETVDTAVRAELEDAGFRQAAYDPFTRRLSISAPGPAPAGPYNTLFVRDETACRARLESAVRRDVLGQAL